MERINFHGPCAHHLCPWVGLRASLIVRCYQIVRSVTVVYFISSRPLGWMFIRRHCVCGVMNGPPEGRIQLKLSAFFEWRHTHSAVAFDRKIVQLAHVEPLILIDGRIMKAEVGGWGPPTDLVGHQSRRQFAVAPQFDYKSCADGASLSLTDSFSDGQSPEVSVSGRIPAEHPAGLGKIGCS